MNWKRVFLCILTVIAIVGCHNRKKQRTPSTPNQYKNSRQPEDTSALLQSLETSFSQHPDVNTGLQLANLYAETRNAKAVNLCDALLTKDTARELTDAVFIKGIYYANVNDTAAAMRLFDECINRDWRFIEAYIEKGILQYNRKDFTSALKTFELAVKVANTYPDTYYWLAKCQEAIGQKEEALANYFRALALDKDFKEAKEGMERLN